MELMYKLIATIGLGLLGLEWWLFLFLPGYRDIYPKTWHQYLEVQAVLAVFAAIGGIFLVW